MPIHREVPAVSDRRRLTVVAPVHNEAENVGVLVQRIVSACEGESDEWAVDILLVDDGSTDATLAKVDAMARKAIRSAT
ncbi:MAG: glycosyltransferase [Tepidisphaeraceae bacterium]